MVYCNTTRAWEGGGGISSPLFIKAIADTQRLAEWVFSRVSSVSGVLIRGDIQSNMDCYARN
jgi:hypothetical protein